MIVSLLAGSPWRHIPISSGSDGAVVAVLFIICVVVACRYVITPPAGAAFRAGGGRGVRSCRLPGKAAQRRK